MTFEFNRKKQIISQVVLLLEQLIESQSPEPAPQSVLTETQPVEMLTVKECAALVNGLSEHTVRQLAMPKYSSRLTLLTSIFSLTPLPALT